MVTQHPGAPAHSWRHSARPGTLGPPGGHPHPVTLQSPLTVCAQDVILDDLQKHA